MLQRLSVTRAFIGQTLYLYFGLISHTSFLQIEVATEILQRLQVTRAPQRHFFIFENKI